MNSFQLLTDEEVELVSGGIRLDEYKGGDDIRDLGRGNSSSPAFWAMGQVNYMTALMKYY